MLVTRNQQQDEEQQHEKEKNGQEGERNSDDKQTTTAVVEEEEPRKGERSESTTTVTKSKKHVHYPPSNGHQPVTVTLKTDSQQDNHDQSLPIEQYSLLNSGSLGKPTPGDHVIPIESNRRRSDGCCSLRVPLRRRLHRFLTPWREFIAYQSRWSWVILVASFLTYSIGEALTSVFPILFVALQKEFPDEGSSRVALVQSMMNAVPCLSGPIASIMTTRFGYRKTTMLGGVVTSVSLLATSFAHRLEILYVTMGIFYAFGNSLVLVATVVAVTEHFDAKPSFASGVTISGGAFGQCVFAIVLQKLIDKFKWHGAMRLFSGVILSVVVFGALFREVEWDEEDYDEEEGEEDEAENANESGSTGATAPASAESTETAAETAHVAGSKPELDAGATGVTSTPPPKTSTTDDMFFYDQFTKQELFDQYSRSELCLPLAVRQHLENEFRHQRKALDEEQQHEGGHDDTQQLSSSTTQIEQKDETDRAAEVPPIVERSNSCKDLHLPMSKSRELSRGKSIASNAQTAPMGNSRKARPHPRRSRRVSTSQIHDGKPVVFYYPFHHQHHNMATVANSSTRTHSSHHHHHHHHHHPLHLNRGNLSHLALCSKNIYNYESVLNICKLQSLHFSIDRSLSLPNLYSPTLAGRKRHRSSTITGAVEDYLEDEDEEEDEKIEKSFIYQLYRDVCKLVRVLRILPFALLCMSVTMITIFYDATWTFLVDYMGKNRLTPAHGSHLILGVGIVAIFGEIGYGYMGDSKRVSPLHLYACSLCLAGLSQLIIPFVIESYSLLMPLMLFIGFLQCAQEVLMPILCIKFAGAQNFTNAYGMLLLCQGVSSLIGPPVLGHIADKKSYALTYFVTALGTSIASTFLFTMPLVQKCYGILTAKSKKQKNNTLVTSSNGDLPFPAKPIHTSSNNGTLANI